MTPSTQNLRLELSRMRDLPVGVRARIRELSLGPYQVWGSWSWTFHDGSCWAACLFLGEELVAWAAVTLETDVRPVIGTFTAEAHRGKGFAGVVVPAVLNYLLAARVLTPGDEVACSTERWARYPQVIVGCGLRCLTWE